MGLFDIVVDGIRGMADESYDHDDGDGDGDVFGTLSRLLGGARDDYGGDTYDGDTYGDDEDGDSFDDDRDGQPGGGGWDFLGRVVDHLSGDGRGDPPVDELADRIGSYLPPEVRDMAGSLLHGEDGGWAGRSVEPGATHTPADWRPSASAAFGHSFGASRAAGGNWIADAPSDRVTPEEADRLTQIALASGNRHLIVGDDRDGNGLADAYERRAYDQDGDGLPDAYQRTAYDRDGDGYPDRPSVQRYDLDGDGVPDDYDAFVTSGAAAGGLPTPVPVHLPVPDDPTFPVDEIPTSVAGTAPAASDFQQSIDAADQVDQSMAEMLEGLE